MGEKSLVEYDRDSRCWRESETGTHWGEFDGRNGWIPFYDLPIDEEEDDDYGYAEQKNFD